MYQPFDLSGKAALVTGGNAGIGLGMAEALAQAGASVAIWGRREDKNAEAREALARHGGKVFAKKVDVGEEAAVSSAMEETVAGLGGRLDCCIANAGISSFGHRFTELPGSAWRAVLRVNLEGAAFTLREAARHMVERAKAGDPGGSLIGVSSLSALEGATGFEAYAASKGGLLSLIRALATGHARFGIRANAILPGWIATDMTAQAQDNPAFEERIVPRIPLRRWGAPADFGGIAVYLASEAAAYHTGDTIIIDGAYSIF